MNIQAEIKELNERVAKLQKADDSFNYRLLSRLQQDCEYYLNHGKRSPKHLWAGDEKAQIKKMKDLYKGFRRDERPDWISYRDILKYEKEMVSKTASTRTAGKLNKVEIGRVLSGLRDAKDATQIFQKITKLNAPTMARRDHMYVEALADRAEDMGRKLNDLHSEILQLPSEWFER